MGVLYDQFKQNARSPVTDCPFDKVRLVKLTCDGKNYEIYFTKKRANKYSVIHCVGKTVEWEQVPVLPRIVGRLYGLRVPIVTLSPSKDCVRIVVIKGKPNCIAGLDDGIFRSARKYDEGYINVMSQARFKEL